MNSVELRNDRAKLVADARKIYQRAEEDKRGVTSEDQQEFDRLMQAADEMQGQYERLEKLETLERNLNESRGRVSTPAHAERGGAVVADNLIGALYQIKDG